MRAFHVGIILLIIGSAVGTTVSAGSRSPAATGDRGATNVLPERAAVTASDTSRQRAWPPAPSGTVNVLAIRRNAPNRSTLHEAYVDLGPALHFETAAASYRIGTLAAVERVTAVSNASRGEQLKQEIARIAQRADALGVLQRRVLRAYVQQETSAEELLMQLAHLDREARALERRRQRLYRLANRSGVDLNEERLERIKRELGLYTGSVRARATAALSGEIPPNRFYAAATARGVVLATLTDNAYVREAYRGDLRQVRHHELTSRETLAAVERAYPEAWAAREQASFDGGRIGIGRVTYGTGRLTTMIASGNERVFADEHWQRLRAAATTATATHVRAGLRLTVNRTYAGGPMRIELRDTDGNPVNASVTIGPAGGESALVGRTGNNGVLWALTPGERYTVVAIRGRSVVFLTMDPLSTPRPRGNGPSGSA